MNEAIKQDSSATVVIPDDEIITRVLKGEKDLYALLVRKYNQRLYRIGLSLIGDDHETEDVMQTAYIKAYENLAKFEFKSAFSTWLIRILINESLLRIKKRKQSVTVNADIVNGKIYQQYSAGSQTPLMKVLNTELKKAIEEAIRQLPEKYRTVFIMREIEDMNVAETQECLALSEVNVKVRLNRAKAMLRDSLSAYYKQEELFPFHLSRCDRVIENVMKEIERS